MFGKTSLALVLYTFGLPGLLQVRLVFQNQTSETSGASFYNPFLQHNQQKQTRKPADAAATTSASLVVGCILCNESTMEDKTVQL